MTPGGAEVQRWTLRDWEERLSDPPDAEFTGAETAGLPEPVRRYLTAAIAPGTPLARCVGLRMRGRIKVGRWLPFSARQVLNPHRGFVWTGRAGGVIAGSDQYIDGAGALEWKVARLVTVATGAGPDVSRSAAGRAGAEAIWVPTALLPRFGVRWTAEDDLHVTAHHRVGATAVDLRLALDADGRVRSVSFDRWGDPDRTGTWAEHRFGGEITGWRTFGGLTVPHAGLFGWHFGGDRWPDGAFFRYEISALELPEAG